MNQRVCRGIHAIRIDGLVPSVEIRRRQVNGMRLVLMQSCGHSLGVDYVYVESRGAHGHHAVGTFEAFVGSHREIWIGRLAACAVASRAWSTANASR